MHNIAFGEITRTHLQITNILLALMHIMARCTDEFNHENENEHAKQINTSCIYKNRSTL